ncbi:MAG TPA: hypothetical protein VL199_10030 [Burkholderiales bacterium]|jgi:hypothetical protein|nr:hypothetical protein [Burkholderiales bacterium]
MRTILFAFLLVAGAAQAQEWTYSLTPYVWLPNVNGKLKYEVPPGAGGAPEVDTGPNNYLQNLSMVLMLAGEARKGDWAVFTDFIYLKFDKEKSNVNSINFGGNRVTTSADVHTQSGLKGYEWTIGTSRTVLKSPRYTLDLLGGLRYFHIEANSDWQLATTVSGPGGGQTFPSAGSVSRESNLWDGIVGVRGRVRWGDTPWYSPYYLDVGGGSSNLTWQGIAGVAYGFKWGDLLLAYRKLYYDQGDDKLLQNFSFSGPTLGATFRF